MKRNRLTTKELERLAEAIAKELSPAECEPGATLGKVRIDALIDQAEGALGVKVTPANIRSALVRVHSRGSGAVEQCVDGVQTLATELSRIYRVLGVEPIDSSRLASLAKSG